MMECGYIYHAAGSYEQSNGILLPASDLARIIPVSIGQQAASLFTNETRTNYRGEDFEKVLLRMFLGINFFMLGRYDEARIEFKGVNNELARIKNDRGESRYGQNVMAKYLTGLAYEISGDLDKDQEDLEFAYIEYQQVLKLRPGYEAIKHDILRLAKKLDYQDDLARWKQEFSVTGAVAADDDRGEVVIIAQTGRCAVKKSRGKLLEDRAMKAGVVTALATGNLAAGVTVGAVMGTIGQVENPIPAFVRRPGRIDHCLVRVGDTTFRAEMLEDVSAAAIANMEALYPLLAQKVAASIVVKAAASVAAGIAAKQISDGAGGKSALGSLLGALAGIGTGVALFAQIKPDLRCWHTLPDRLHLSRIALPQGNHEIVIEFRDATGALIKKKSHQLTVEKGKKVFINERTLI
jgi:hypothetical protein